MASKQELLDQLKEGVIDFEEEQVQEAAKQAVEEEYPALEMIMDGLAAGMEVVGDLYDKNEYFVPEVLMCAEALYGGLAILRPHVPKQDSKATYQVVIGTIQGDVHDIGKNIVKMMFDVAGWTVHDLGKDVPLEDFVEKQINTNSEVVALSAMMTTTMLGMQKVIDMIKEKNPNCQILLGGAPVSQEVASSFGADGYAETASNAITEAIKMVSTLREYESKK